MPMLRRSTKPICPLVPDPNSRPSPPGRASPRHKSQKKSKSALELTRALEAETVAVADLPSFLHCSGHTVSLAPLSSPACLACSPHQPGGPQRTVLLVTIPYRERPLLAVGHVGAFVVLVVARPVDGRLEVVLVFRLVSSAPASPFHHTHIRVGRGRTYKGLAFDLEWLCRVV